MAPLPPYCDHAAEIQRLLREGRTRDARLKMISCLRDGVNTRLFLDVVADFVEVFDRPKGKGRPAHNPREWYEITISYQVLRDASVTREDAIRRLSKRFGQSESTVERAIRFGMSEFEAYEVATRG